MSETRMTQSGFHGLKPDPEASPRVQQQHTTTQSQQSSAPAYVMTQPGPIRKYVLSPYEQGPKPHITPIQSQRSPIILQLNQRPTSLRKMKHFNSSRSKTLGVLQLVFGGIAFILNVTGLVVQTKVFGQDGSNSDGYLLISAIWSTVFFAVSGAFALCSAAKKTYCLIVAQLVMGIIASVCAFVTLLIATWIITDDILCKAGLYFGPSDSEIYSCNKHQTRMSLTVCVLFLMFSVLIVLVTVWSSAIGCKICCSDIHQTDSEHVHYIPNVDSSHTEVLVLDGQGLPIQGACIISIPIDLAEQALSLHAHHPLPQLTADTKNPGLPPPPYEYSRYKLA